METQDILKNLREKNHLTQEEMATRIHVTRQAVSRWETGDTLPNTETLKLFANVNHFFTLLGKMFFTPYGKEFFTSLSKQIFTS